MSEVGFPGSGAIQGLFEQIASVFSIQQAQAQQTGGLATEKKLSTGAQEEIALLYGSQLPSPSASTQSTPDSGIPDPGQLSLLEFTPPESSGTEAQASEQTWTPKSGDTVFGLATSKVGHEKAELYIKEFVDQNKLSSPDKIFADKEYILPSQSDFTPSGSALASTAASPNPVRGS